MSVTLLWSIDLSIRTDFFTINLCPIYLIVGCGVTLSIHFFFCWVRLFCCSLLYALKQTARKLERQWRSSNLEESQLVWKDGLITYKKALPKARTAYYSSLIEGNKNNPRFLFSTVARLTKSPSSVAPCIPLTLSSDDFMRFFINKIVSIREKM